MSSGFKIGVDGGGTKTECVLLDASGAIVARHLAPASNPNVVGPEQARHIVTAALEALRALTPAGTPPPVLTHLYMAGSRSFWLDVARLLTGCGEVAVFHDALPVLELATHGQPGLVLHAGTGSFVAARAPDGSTHYAGGLGWRFGDPGSGYDLGRRAIACALLELQGWAPLSRLTAAVRAATPLGETADAAAITRYFYQHPEPNREIAGLSPAVLRLAGEGEAVAHQIVIESTAGLLTLATQVMGKLFSGVGPEALRAGLSGPILTHPVVTRAFAGTSHLPLVPVEGSPVDGIRRLLRRA